MNNILKNNKLIAEFMGFNIHKRRFLFWTVYDIYKNDKRITINGWFKELDAIKRYKFHESWDWLMPVIEKISKIKLEGAVDFIDVAYPITFNMPDEDGNRMFRFKGFKLHRDKYLINTAYEAVVDVIKFLNDK